jgi:hypothetical protein
MATHTPEEAAVSTLAQVVARSRRLACAVAQRLEHESLGARSDRWFLYQNTKGTHCGSTYCRVRVFQCGQYRFNGCLSAEGAKGLQDTDADLADGIDECCQKRSHDRLLVQKPTIGTFAQPTSCSHAHLRFDIAQGSRQALRGYPSRRAGVRLDCCSHCHPPIMAGRS